MKLLSLYLGLNPPGHAQMYLLNREGSRRVVPIAFETWRKCTSSQRQGMIQDILQVGKWEQRSPQKHINTRKKGRHAASWGWSRIGFASRNLDLPRSWEANGAEREGFGTLGSSPGHRVPIWMIHPHHFHLLTNTPKNRSFSKTRTNSCRTAKLDIPRWL